MRIRKRRGGQKRNKKSRGNLILSRHKSLQGKAGRGKAKREG